MYFLTGERQTPRGDEKTRCYELGLRAFEAGRKYMCEGKRLERVEINSPDGVLPGYIIPIGKESEKRNPVVIFYNGFDVTKELLYGIIREEFANRGIMCLVIDTPGTGEPLRLRGVASRSDYEVPTTAIVNYLLTRMDVDGERIGLVGISLGGYYAPRGAAFEKRIKAVVAWGAIWDYGKTWQRRWETRTEKTSVPFWQLPWVMGTETMEEALVKVRAWSLKGVLGTLTQPFLIVHGEEDGLVPMEDARKQFDAASSGDKQLRVFSAEEGSCEHVGADDIDPVRQLVADWFAQRLGTATRSISSSH